MAAALFHVTDRDEKIPFDSREEAVAEARQRSLERRREVPVEDERHHERIVFQQGALQSYAYRLGG